MHTDELSIDDPHVVAVFDAATQWLRARVTLAAKFEAMAFLAWDGDLTDSVYEAAKPWADPNTAYFLSLEKRVAGLEKVLRRKSSAAQLRECLAAVKTEPFDGSSYDPEGGYGPSLHQDLPEYSGPLIAFEDGPDDWAFDLCNDDGFLALCERENIFVEPWESFILALSVRDPG